MTPPGSPPVLRTALAHSPGTEARSHGSSNPRLRLARSSARVLETRLEHALQMLDARSAPLVSMLRIRTVTGPFAHHHANRDQRRRP